MRKAREPNDKLDRATDRTLAEKNATSAAISDTDILKHDHISSAKSCAYPNL